MSATIADMPEFEVVGQIQEIELAVLGDFWSSQGSRSLSVPVFEILNYTSTEND